VLLAVIAVTNRPYSLLGVPPVKIPPSPLYQKGGGGDFGRLAAQVNRIEHPRLEYLRGLMNRCIQFGRGRGAATCLR
jgi:hypothetical protein